MSFLVTAWAETAPVADVYERAIITCMAHKAASDGTGCYRSVAGMAAFACCDSKTIERRLVALRKRGVIAYGDQALTKHLPADKRPKVYDLLVPYDWYSAAQRDEVDLDRARHGLPPLKAEDRPAIAPPGAKGRKPRSDRGQPRRVPTPAGSAGSPSSELVPEGPGGLTVPPLTDPVPNGSRTSGGSNSRPAGGLTVAPRGVYKTPNTVPVTSPLTSPLGGETPPPKPRRTETTARPARVVTTELKPVGNPPPARELDDVDEVARVISQQHPDLGHAEVHALAAEQFATGAVLGHDEAMSAIRRTLAETAGTGTRRRRRPGSRPKHSRVIHGPESPQDGIAPAAVGDRAVRSATAI